MRLYLCLDCGNIYNGDYAHFKKDCNGDYMCPKYDCGGYVFEIDELMVKPIKELNKKHYYTMNCCSGHMHENSTMYIQFNPLYAPSTCPEGFYIDNIYGVSIRANIEGDIFTSERVLSIANNICNLMKWVEELPDRYTEMVIDEFYKLPELPKSIIDEFDKRNDSDAQELLFNIQEVIYDRLWSKE